MSNYKLVGAMTPSPRTMIYGSIGVSIAFVMELALVPLLLPEIRETLNLSIPELAWVFNAYGLAVAVGVLIGGWVGDHFNTIRVFTLGVLCFAIGSGVVAFADQYSTVIAARVLQGLGGGIFSPLIPILLTRAAPDRPGKVLIIWGSVAGCVATLAPLMYSGIFLGTGWSAAFAFMGLLSLIALAIVWRSSADINNSAKSASKRDYSQLFQSAELWLMMAYVFCTYGCITYYLFRLPLLLTENAFGALDIGLLLSLMWLSFSLVGMYLRNKVDGPLGRRILLSGPVFIAAGLVLALWCEGILCLGASAVLIGVGFATSNAPSTQLILTVAPRDMSALSASLDITFARLGGVVVVSILAENFFDFAVPATTLLLAVAFLCALKATKTVQQRALATG